MRRVTRKTLHTTIIIFILLLTLTILAGFRFANRNATTASLQKQKYFSTITVHAGDSLWNIAQKNMGSEYSSVEEYIDEVKQINHLNDTTLTAGSHLVIPFYAMR